MFGLWQPRYRYNLLNNVRIETETGKVYRKYVMVKKGKLTAPYWKQVDYKTTHLMKDARPCPPDMVKQTLKTAF